MALANAAAQFIAARYLRTSNIVPDFTLLFIVYTAIFVGGSAGLLTAFVFGFYQDLLFRSPAGGHAIIYLVIAYLANRLFSSKVAMQPRNSFILTGVFSFCFAMLYRSLLPPAWTNPIFLKPLLFSLLNGVLSIPAFALYHRGLT